MLCCKSEGRKKAFLSSSFESISRPCSIQLLFLQSSFFFSFNFPLFLSSRREFAEILFVLFCCCCCSCRCSLIVVFSAAVVPFSLSLSRLRRECPFASFVVFRQTGRIESMRCRVSFADRKRLRLIVCFSTTSGENFSSSVSLSPFNFNPG